MLLVLTCKCYQKNMLGNVDWTECSVTLPFKKQVRKAFSILKKHASAGVELTWISHEQPRRAEVLFYETYEDRRNDKISVKIYEDGEFKTSYKCKFDVFKKCFYKRATKEECIL